jgi:hypothetical protein
LEVVRSRQGGQSLEEARGRKFARGKEVGGMRGSEVLRLGGVLR